MEVVIVGPAGIGPGSERPLQVVTDFDHKAPPKSLRVARDENDPERMIVAWRAACPSLQSEVGYIVSNVLQRCSFLIKLCQICGIGA